MEGRHNSGTIEICLPREESIMAEVHAENEAGEEDGTATGGGSMGNGGGIESGGVQRNKKRRGVQETNGI